MRINIQFDHQQVNNVRLMMGEISNGAPKVIMRAINKTLPGVQNDATREIAKDLNLTQTRIRKDFRINKATLYGWSEGGSVVATGRPVNLASFIGSRTTTRGLSIKVKKSKARSVLKHAFIWHRKTKAGADAATAMEREWHDFHTKASPRLPWKKFGSKYRVPVEILTGPRIEDEYAKPNVLSEVETKARARLDGNLAHELDYALSKLK